MDNIKSSFRKWQKDHPNFMTPTIEELLAKDNHIVEVSSGTRLFQPNKLMFGVSPAKFIGGEKQFQTITDKGKSFYSKVKAKAFAKKLLKDLK